MDDFKDLDNSINKKDEKLDVEDTLSALFDTKQYFKKETFDWLLGDKSSKPEDIKKLGDDFGNKINWFIGVSVIKMYSRLPRLIDWTMQVENRLMRENQPDTAEFDDLIKMYNAFTKDIGNVMEFARKFVVQNKDLFNDGSDFFDRQLYEKIKTLPTDLIKDYLLLMSIVDKRGHNWLKKVITDNN